MVAGAQLAMDDINTSNPREKVAIISRQYDNPPGAVAVLRELVERERTDAIVGPATASAGMAVQEVVREKGIPLFLVANSVPAASAAPGTFQFNPDDEEILDQLTSYIHAAYAGRTVVLSCERPPILSCPKIIATLTNKLGSRFQGSRDVKTSSSHKEVIVVAVSSDSPLVRERPHEDNTVVAVVRPEISLFTTEFWPLSMTYNEGALSKKLRDALRAKGASGNSSEAMLAHQVYTAVQIASLAWNERPGRDPAQFMEILRKKREVDTILGKISVNAGKLICPNCIRTAGCTTPKEPCKNDSSKCCEKGQ
jgi:Periplasmic binding protein